MTVSQDFTTYIALFHHRDNAASAIRDLEAAGFPRSALTVIGGGNGSNFTEGAGTFGQGYQYGDQNGLAAMGAPEADRKHLQDGLGHGGVVLALEGAGEHAEEIEKIFSKHSTKKINDIGIENNSYIAPAASSPGNVALRDEAVIPVSQEELVVGKHQVDRGGVRIVRRIVEEPVSQSVSLSEEKIIVDRRPVDRPVTGADLLGGDRIIELTETAEEAVIEKTARVVEEVHVGKETTEHTETIHNTVRRTEVDVEQLGFTDGAQTKAR